jgi:hypothetical protein
MQIMVSLVSAMSFIVAAGSLAPAATQVRNHMRAANLATSDLRVYPYSGGTTRLFDVASDWSSGTFSNTATNATGDLVLATVPGGTASSGTWESPTIDSGGNGNSAVYGLVQAASTLSTGTANVALGKPSSQSSTGFSGIASFGNDGNTNGTYGYAAGSVFHTNLEQGWWEVDLGANAPVTSIALWNRTDCCQARATNLWVLVSPNPFPSALATALLDATITKVQVAGVVGSPSTVLFSSPALGRYVRVWQPFVQYLHLAEVQVFATTATAASFQIATADSATGPWTFVGPDGTATSTYTTTTLPFPYGADGHRFYRVKATLTGTGATPSVQTLRTNHALAAVARTAFGTHALSAPVGTLSWVARIKSNDASLASKAARITLGTGSAWNTTSLQLSLDTPATLCCSSPYITVVGGAATSPGAAGVSTYAVGSDNAISVVAQRTNTVGATAVVTVQISPSNATRAEIPLTITFP